MRMFLRQSVVGREPLAVTMSGVRMGERALQIGLNDPRVAGMLAAKPGLSGQSAIVVPDETSAGKLRKAIADSGALVDLKVNSLDSLPFEDGAFDVVVVHNRDGMLMTVGAPSSERVLGECRRILRPGGRVVILEAGTPTGLGAILRARASREARSAGGESTVRGLESAGFRAVRILGDRDNYRFIEGMKVDRFA
jgi:SAM-dependent methyltransferase